jgi:hypothetical protein
MREPVSEDWRVAPDFAPRLQLGGLFRGGADANKIFKADPPAASQETAASGDGWEDATSYFAGSGDDSGDGDGDGAGELPTDMNALLKLMANEAGVDLASLPQQMEATDRQVAPAAIARVTNRLVTHGSADLVHVGLWQAGGLEARAAGGGLDLAGLQVTCAATCVVAAVEPVCAIAMRLYTRVTLSRSWEPEIPGRHRRVCSGGRAPAVCDGGQPELSAAHGRTIRRAPWPRTYV